MGHNFEFIGPAEGAKGDPPPACVRCGQDEELVALGVRLHVLYSLNVLLTHGGPQLRHIITFINKKSLLSCACCGSRILVQIGSRSGSRFWYQFKKNICLNWNKIFIIRCCFWSLRCAGWWRSGCEWVAVGTGGPASCATSAPGPSSGRSTTHSPPLPPGQVS